MTDEVAGVEFAVLQIQPLRLRPSFSSPANSSHTMLHVLLSVFLKLSTSHPELLPVCNKHSSSSLFWVCG